MFPGLEYLTLTLAVLGLASARSVHLGRAQQNTIPKYSFAPDTVKSCTWWLDNDGTWTCPKVEETFELSMTDFQRWNPSIALPCNALPKGQSFCLAATEGRITIEVPVTVGPTVTVTGGPTVTVSTATTQTASTTITVSKQTTLTVSAVSTLVVSGITVPVTIPVSIPIPLVSTTTVTVTGNGRGRNGLSTPLPYQSGMVENCKSFYFVQQGETCNAIAARFHIEEGQIVAWNPGAKADCTNLTAENYACVGIL